MSRRWIVNASPLIFLGKINALNVLQQLADEVIVPSSVHREVLAKRRLSRALVLLFQTG